MQCAKTDLTVVVKSVFLFLAALPPCFAWRDLAVLMHGGRKMRALPSRGLQCFYILLNP